MVPTQYGARMLHAALHTGLHVVSPTGSTTVGGEVGAAAIRSCAPPWLELGVNAPLIVLADANLESVMNGILRNKCRAGAKTCVAVNRVLIARGVHDKFGLPLHDRPRLLSVG